MNAAFVYTGQSDAPLYVASDVLGTSIDVEIAGLAGKIWMPKFGPLLGNGIFHQVIPPDRFHDGILSRLSGPDDIDWGRQYSHPGGETLVSSFLLEFDLTGEEDEVREEISRIEGRLDAWFGVVRDWLETLTHQDLATEHPLDLGQSSPRYRWSWHDGSHRISTMGARGHMTIRVLDGTPPIDSRIWIRAIHHANIHQRPPSPCLVLRDARAMRMRESHSYSVALSAMAAEAALSDEVRKELSAVGIPTGDIDKVLNRTFGYLVKYCMDHLPQISLPSDTRLKLVDVRNRVIHHGYQASQQESLDAHNIAEKIVGLSPL
jgi:hypothetical protein